MPDTPPLKAFQAPSLGKGWGGCLAGLGWVSAFSFTVQLFVTIV